MIDSIRSINITFAIRTVWKESGQTMLHTRKCGTYEGVSCELISGTNRCQRIITQNQPGPQDCHGCPYRHFSGDRLQTALLSSYGQQGLSASDLPEIMSAVKQGHFHVACTKVFEVTHGLPRGQGLDGESVTHPNQYAAKSREMEKAKLEASGGVKTEVKDESAMEL